MADKYLELDTTNLVAKRKEAIQVSTGAADAGKIPALDAAGFIDPSMLRDNEVKVYTATEAIDAGKFINVWDNGGSKMRLASNAGISTRADGFVLSTVASGATTYAYLYDGLNTALSSLTVGVEYYLGTAGGVTTSPPLTTNSLVQKLGKSNSATEMAVDIEQPIIA